MQKDVAEKTMSTEEAVAQQEPLIKLKSIFPNSKFAKHEPLDMILTPVVPSQPRTLVVRDLGAVSSDWLTTTIFLSYFEGSAPSPPVSFA